MAGRVWLGPRRLQFCCTRVWESSGASAKSQPWNQLLLASVSQPSLYPSMAENILYTHTHTQPCLSGNSKSLSACIVLFILSFLSGADLFIILHTSVCSSAHGASCLSCNCSSIISGDESQGLMRAPLSLHCGPWQHLLIRDVSQNLSCTILSRSPSADFSSAIGSCYVCLPVSLSFPLFLKPQFVMFWP